LINFPSVRKKSARGFGMPSACGCPTAGIGRPGRRIAMRECVQAAIGEGDHMVDDIGEHFGKPVVKTLPLTPRGPSPLAGISEAGEQAAQRDEVDAAMSRHAAIAVVHFARDEFVGAGKQVDVGVVAPSGVRGAPQSRRDEFLGETIAIG